MTPSEFASELAAATAERPLVLTLDTNAVFGKKLIRLMEQINRWGVVVDRVGAIRVRLNPLVFVERNVHERRVQLEKKKEFEPRKVREWLESKDIEVPPFDLETADRASATLVTWHATKDDWKSAKWERVCELYGGTSAATSPPGRQISATVDWFIAAAIERDAVLVTDDTGVEFKKVERRVTYAVARDAFQLPSTSKGI